MLYLATSVSLFTPPFATLTGSNPSVHKETAHSADLQLESPSASALDQPGFSSQVSDGVSSNPKAESWPTLFNGVLGPAVLESAS